MVNWRAVTIGFVIGLLVAIVGFALPVIGQIGAGLIGGFVAGYLAGGGLWRGAVHGLLAGALGGLFITVFVAVAITFLGVVTLQPAGGLLGGLGIAGIGLFLAFLFALDSALAGAIGGVLGGD